VPALESPSITVRLADPRRDADAVAEVYRPAVEQTIASFELAVPSAVVMRQRMEKVVARTPWLVAELDGEVVGYAYASPHHERLAYAWSVDVSVYVRPDRHRLGVARALYAALFALLRTQGFVNVYAGISLPNEASVLLHEEFGMRQLGVFHAVGFKFGAWHDVAWFELRLSDPPGEPPPPTPLPLLMATEEGRATVEAVLARTG
jgi:phosphinothricin acetyltransferase